jgi:class 3 adenylate cyclase
VANDELPESEKVHDRNAVAGSFAAIWHHSWKLLSATDNSVSGGSAERAENAAILRGIWEQRGDDEAEGYPADDYRGIARRALELGELLLACDAALAGLRHYAGDPDLTRLAARALAEMGRPETARARVETLVAAGHEDSETLGLLGRTWKDEGFSLLAAGFSPDAAWEHSAQAYGRAFALNEDYFTGINAATMAFLHGDLLEVGRLAGKVDRLAADSLAVDGEDHWALATRGEVALLTRRWKDAEGFYQQAASRVASRSADLASMGRQARRLLAEWKRRGLDADQETGWIESVFPQADVLVFSGYLADFPGREEESRGAFLTWLERVGTRVVYTSLSTAADLLMAEAALERGISLRLVLTKPVAETGRGSDAPHAGCHQRLHEVCKRADSITVLGDGTGPDNDLAVSHCNRVLTGLAKLDADALGVKVRGLVAWSGVAGDVALCTAECLIRWRQAGIQVDVIEPATGRRREDGGENSGDIVETTDTCEGMVVRSMLFADVKGFSQLNERELYLFMREFRGALARLVDEGPAPCEMVNTWGDGVLMVFRDAVAAARMALAFRDMVATKDWAACGLDRSLGIRIGLHAGPVWAVAFDPILRKPDFSGGNINRAARIEPITEVNQIYASDGFAALVRLAGEPGFRLDYVGSLSLVKNYGRQRLFRLDRSAGAQCTAMDAGSPSSGFDP